MGNPSYFWGIFISKKKKNRGRLSAQIITKIGKNNKLQKTVSCTKVKREEELLMLSAKSEMGWIKGSLFVKRDDLMVENFVNSIANDHLQIMARNYFGKDL